jgi:predicted ATPase
MGQSEPSSTSVPAAIACDVVNESAPSHVARPLRPRLFGRSAEIRSMVGFVTGLRRPSVLLLEGQAGIGKTSLWNAAVERAQEQPVQTLTAFPSAAETRLPYAGLGDLLGGLDGHALGGLPENYRRALDVALLRLEHTPTEGTYQRAVSAAVLHLFRKLTDQAPVLVAIDDVQWLDPPSAQALTFAFRRLEERPAGLLMTVRSGEGNPVALDQIVPAESFRRMELNPLTLDELDLALFERLGQRLPLPVLLEVARSSGGNPFSLLSWVARCWRDGSCTGQGGPSRSPPI